MKTLLASLVALLLLQWPDNPIFRVTYVNRLLTEAASAYKAQEYPRSKESYEKILTELQWQSPALLLNLSNSYFHNQELPLAQRFYELTVQQPFPGLAAKAYAQMGLLAYRQQQLEQALEHYKNALRQDPYNEIARYNYELINRKLQEQMPPKQDPNPEEQEKEDAEKSQENQDQQENPERENSEREAQPSTQKQIEELEMSEEKARMMLEALKENELQYIQQQQQKAKKSKGRNERPDW